jgi:outer membrane protein insertion porin family
VSLAQDFAGLGGTDYYLRSVGEFRGYYPIIDKIIFATRAAAGNISGWNGQDVHLSDLFFKGGETIRGFYTAGYGPRDIATDTALGGELFYAGTAEVRFPLPGVPDDMGLSGAVFADAGSLWKASAQASLPGVNLDDNNVLRSSVGVSLMWASPLGPLRADYAYVLSKDTYDKLQAFRFGASTNF